MRGRFSLLQNSVSFAEALQFFGLKPYKTEVLQKLRLLAAIFVFALFASCRNPWFQFQPDDGTLHSHQWGEWTITAAATETADGVETRTCSVCGETETRTAYATGTAGLDYTLSGNAYIVSADSVTSGAVHIPAYYRPNADSPYLPVTIIGASAFVDCSNLTSVTIPSSVTTIGVNAFQGCSNLTSVTIPSSVTAIGATAFQGCSSLTSVTIPEGVTYIGSSTFQDCSSLTSVTIPSSVTSIGESAFSDCSNLTSVTIPSSVTSIGDSAFWGCSSLSSVTIPEGVTSISDYAFFGCSNLTSVIFKSPSISIDGNVFNGNLRALYLVGGIGTYTTTAPVGNNSEWTKQ